MSILRLTHINHSVLGISECRAASLWQNVLQEANSTVVRESVSNWHSRHNVYISTSSTELNNLFGGKGVPVGTMNHIYGRQGTGCSQICLQLMANARISENNGGAEGSSIYIGKLSITA